MIEEQICGTTNATITKSISIPFILQFQIIGGVLIKGGEATDNLNTNKRGVQINGGGGGLKNVIGQKWQPVITNYGCPKQLLTVEKHQYNFSCSLHLFIKQNGTFLMFLTFLFYFLFFLFHLIDTLFLGFLVSFDN